jgi:4-hydroxyphenylpyruvate dioxygenase-like putative hemolysin
MNASNAGALGLGAIDQVAYVVEDLDAALPRYEQLFGAFEIMDSTLEDCTIRGEPSQCRLKLAMNRSGPIEIELIEVLEGETTHSEHLRAHGEGLHHVRFRVDELEPKVEELNAKGFVTLLYKRFGPGVAFAYLETPAELGSSVIELLEMP